MEKGLIYRKNSIISEENYQIDALKMFLTMLVFFNHTVIFLLNNPNIHIDAEIHSFFLICGWVSVHCFFIISGFLMIKSLKKKSFDVENAGKESMQFIIYKFKQIALPYWIANAMFLSMFIIYWFYCNIRNISNSYLPESPILLLLNAIPESFVITNVGGGKCLSNNGPTWYLGSMFFVMLPMCYCLIKKRDFFIYVFSPIFSILSLGYLKQHTFFLEDDAIFLDVVRACCGLCFGILAYTMYEKILSIKENKNVSILLTIIEIILYFTIFAALFICKEKNELVFPTLLLVPIAVAISFSRKSFLSYLFKSTSFRYLRSLSLYIYLNHYAAIAIVTSVFNSTNYYLCVLLAVFITVILCIVNNLVVKLINLFVRKLFI